MRENLVYKKENNLKVYVINLKKDTERLNKFLKNNCHLNIIKFNAIDGFKIKKNDPIYKKHIGYFKHPINTHGAIGCILSHIQLYDYLIKNTNDKYYIICEDDAMICKDFNIKLFEILKQVPEKWDFIYLGGNNIIGYKYSKNLLIPNFNKKGNWGSFGYLISKKGLQKLYENSFNICKSIDEFFKDIVLNVFTSYPVLINHDYNNVSNIYLINRYKETSKRNIIKILN